MSSAVITARSGASSLSPVCQIGKRSLHNTASRKSSPFFALARLSNSRETQHLSKLSKLSRVEHSPTLQLIQSSEVLPYAPPPPPKIPQSEPKTAKLEDAVASKVRIAAKPDVLEHTKRSEETDLMSVGRAILAQKDAEIARLQKALREEQDRSAKSEISYNLAQEKSRERVQRLDSDLSSANVWKWFLVVMGVSYATWTYALNPEEKHTSTSKTWNASPISVSSELPTVLSNPQPAIVSLPLQVEPAFSPITDSNVGSPPLVKDTPIKASSWPNIFWAK